MGLDAKYVYEGLLRYNYFPMVKEHRDDIPPLFGSEDFTTEVAEKLIAHQNAKGTSGRDPRGRLGYDQIEYRTTRYNNVLRLMHIPHPNPFARLCKCVYGNWEHLKYTSENPHSIIKPSHHGGGRVLVMGEYGSIEHGRVVIMGSDRFPEDLMRHLDLSSGAQYFVDVDVSSCFPSLYTHALPWALVGHSTGKDNATNSEHWYNQLDACQRFLKRNETQGVPVGPATSNLMNEIILARVDGALAQEGYRFFRAIDDYKCYVGTLEEAEKFIRDVERELAAYLLTVNAKKVSITALPLPHKVHWITELASKLPPKRITAAQMANFLDHAVMLQNQFPQGSVLKYAARTLSSKVSHDNAEVFFRYMLQVAYHYPIVLPVICEVLQKRVVPLDQDYLHAIIKRNVTFRRSDAISWSLYLLRLAKAALPKEIAEQIVNSDDCVPMATLLAINEHVDLVSACVKDLNAKRLYDLDKHWLLLYELTRAGTFKKSDFDSYVETTGLSVLLDEGVAFIREFPKLERRRVGFDDEAPF